VVLALSGGEVVYLELKANQRALVRQGEGRKGGREGWREGGTWTIREIF
jgi:hypothetical protein